MKEAILDNLMDVRGRIAEACEEHDRRFDDITLVAVAKTHGIQAISSVLSAGVTDIGESRIQEAEPKITMLAGKARWHLIGHLQSNKAKKAVELFDVIHSVDSLKIAEAISKHAVDAEREIDILVQVNSSGEEQKYGFAPEAVLDALATIKALPNLYLMGLMTIGPNTDDTDAVRAAFRETRDLFKRGRDLVGDSFEELSMGMTHDFALAIAEGTTMLRIGSAIFGDRAAQPLSK